MLYVGNMLAYVRMLVVAALVTWNTLAILYTLFVSRFKHLLLYGDLDTSVPAVGIQRLRDRLGAHGDYQTFPRGPHLLLQGRHWPRVTATVKRWAGARATPR